MFDPDGWLPLPYIVTLLAGFGREGKLPRHLGFVHPGDVANPLDLSAEATARHVLGGKLAAGILSAVAIFDPSGLRVPIPAYYWSSGSAAATMETGAFDLNVIELQNGLHMAEVFLNIDEVAAALGFRLIPPTEDTGAPVMAPTDAPPTPSANDDSDERKMVAWLTKLMKDQPKDPITKKDAHARAMDNGLQSISGRSFIRAWSEAVKASGAREWSASGRRKNRRT